MVDLFNRAKKHMEGKEEPPKQPMPSQPVEKEQPPVSEKKPSIFKEQPAKPPVPEKEKVPVKQPVEFAHMLSEITESYSLLEKKEDIARNFMRTSMPDGEEMKKVYFEALNSIREIFNLYKDNATIDENKIMAIANRIVNNVILDSPALIRLIHESDSPELYIYHNAVNVSIISVAMGLIYKYNKSKLLDLAVIGLLHDIDLVHNRHIIDKPAKLNEAELKEITSHPLNAATFVDNALNFTKEIVNGILQHHERKDGNGYPAGLNDLQIQDFAEIVGLADTYASMTHYRPYKEKTSPHLAILNIINTGKNSFSNNVVKALVACIGLYPVGTWLELNTGEICKVLNTNYDSPLRPVISILLDKNKNKLREIRTIDLRDIPSLYIKQIVDEKSVVNS